MVISDMISEANHLSMHLVKIDENDKRLGDGSRQH